MKKHRDRIKELIRVKASELRANASNWREHGEQQKSAMSGILEEVGYVDGLIAVRDKKGVLTLVNGHMRKEVSGDEEVPVLVVDLTPAEVKKVLATFDPIGAMATSNAESLEALLAGVKTNSDGVSKMLAELMSNANASRERVELDEDAIPAVPKKAKTKPGDLYILGDHRLLCGDSTKTEDVDRLLSGQRADLCFTSPPYNAGSYKLTGNQKKTDKSSRYANYADNLPEDQYVAMLRGFTELALGRSTTVAVNIQQLANNKFAVLSWVGLFQNHFVDRAIWYKGGGNPAMAANVMASRFEDFWIFAGENRPSRAIPSAQFRGTVSNVLECAGASADNESPGEHAATMPIKVAAYAIESWSTAGHAIYEPFSGCGTTIVACEQLGRRCFAMEIDPLYCDVAVERWEKLTGKVAKRENR